MGLNVIYCTCVSVMMTLAVITSLLAVFLVGLYSTNANDQSVENNRPIIGVLAETLPAKRSQYGQYYIAASYVKFIESAGGRVVPIFPNATSDDILKIFNYINGVLFPGGGVSLTESGYAKNGKLFYELSVKAFDEGVTFPVLGTCLGFELLNVITSDDKVVLSHVDAENLPTPLIFAEGFKESRMFSNAPEHLLKSIQDSSITMNNHHWGVTPENFQNNKNISSFYNVISTNKDREGKIFVSTIEGKRYPIYGLQWHPEKNQFEWSPRESIPHSPEAIELGQYIANFIVGQARLNNHKFPSPEEEAAALIYNYNPMYTGSFSNFTQMYFF
ncbi:gamma-glutamyl hydrolase [Exaiptasia diaphana]|uniref:folate gamma-glutamyl hydrolase n=1 Tax=Exaiptasia diaphana TaxID=2652724 RepID=A0A913XAB8_EXADI|nr:gamma-glutamyl hydrolase [Exaiptasia diaphana]